MNAELDIKDSAQRPSWTRTFAWLVRRELWEHPAIWIAPAVTAGFVAFLHFTSSLFTSDAERVRTLADPKQAGAFMMLYAAASFAILILGLLVGVLYCLEALQGERRDRTILFWKSLPVSDAATVLSKTFVPMVIIPLVTFVLIVLATTLMFGLQSLAWLARGYDPHLLWARLDMSMLWLSLAYGLPFVALWYAPIYAWVLLVSAWARRMVMLWALAPLVAVLMVEHLILHNTPAHWMVERRLGGGILEPFSLNGHGKVWMQSLYDLDPVRLYTLPGLWIGVLIAVVLLAAAVRLRRSRVPI